MTLLLRTPLVLDAATRNAAAIDRLAEHPRETPVVIVTRDGVSRAYHTSTVGILTEKLGKLPKTKRVADSLDPSQAAATMQVGGAKRAALSEFHGVLLDGYQVYAVVGEPGRAAPAGSRGGSQARSAAARFEPQGRVRLVEGFGAVPRDEERRREVHIGRDVGGVALPGEPEAPDGLAPRSLEPG